MKEHRRGRIGSSKANIVITIRWLVIQTFSPPANVLVLGEISFGTSDLVVLLHRFVLPMASSLTVDKCLQGANLDTMKVYSHGLYVLEQNRLSLEGLKFRRACRRRFSP